jgi:hypothetical protein
MQRVMDKTDDTRNNSNPGWGIYAEIFVILIGLILASILI